MSDQQLDKLVEDLANMAINLGLNIEQIQECLNKATVEQDGKPYAIEEVYDTGGVVESKGGEDVPVSVNNVTLQNEDVDLLA